MIKRKIRWSRLGVGLVLVAWGVGVLLAACESFPVEHRGPITVRVLNGRSGQPLARARLMLLAGYGERDIEQRLWREEAVTDATGQALVPRALRDFPFLAVRVAKAKLCQDTSHGETYNVERIRGEGLHAPNDCGIVTVSDTPEVLVVFARGGPGEAPIQAATPEPRVDFASGAGAESEVAPNAQSRRLEPAPSHIGVGAGRALASVAGSISAKEAEAEPERTATRDPNEIDALLIRGKAGFSEVVAPVIEGTEVAAESYQTMCQPKD